MLRKIIGTVSWKYALGEIALIFIGITIAIWFNNWNESKKAKGIELKSLIELKEAINQDLRDIEENIEGFRNRVSAYEMILENMENDQLPADRLTDKFPYLLGITTFLSNIGPYETLKSRGLEIIRNNSLRVKVSLYYDFEYERIQTNEKQHHDHYRQYIKPELLKKFDLSKPRVEPINYQKLMADFEFKQVINWAYRTDNYMLDIYTILESKCRDLLLDLNAEIDRLN